MQYCCKTTCLSVLGDAGEKSIRMVIQSNMRLGMTVIGNAEHVTHHWLYTLLMYVDTNCITKK